MLKLLNVDQINTILKENEFKHFSDKDLIYFGIPKSSIKGIFKNNILLYCIQYIHIGENLSSIVNYVYKLDITKRRKEQILKTDDHVLSINEIIKKLKKYIDKLS